MEKGLTEFVFILNIEFDEARPARTRGSMYPIHRIHSP